MNDEATRKNILALKEHSEYTRDQVIALHTLVHAQNNTIKTFQGAIDNLQTQLRALQVKLFTGGATDGNND